MAGPARKPVQGFTLLEVTVTLALLMLLTGLATAALTPWLAFQQRLDTDARLTRIAAALGTYLDQQALVVAQMPASAGLPLPGGLLADGTVISNPAQRQALAQALHLSAADLDDGFHQPWMLHATALLTTVVEGVVLHYRVLAVVSPGDNGHPEPATQWNAATGGLVLAGDDRGVRVDGLPVAQQAMVQVRQRVDRLATALQDWFQLRWQGDADRDVGVDYFAAPCPGSAVPTAWDGGAGALPGACAGWLDASQLAASLALAPGDLLDGTGAALRVDSRSPATRNPEQPDAALRAPPYSVQVHGALPGGGDVVRAVLGTY